MTNDPQVLSEVMVQAVARMVAEGRHQHIPVDVLAAYEAQTGLKVPPLPKPTPAPCVDAAKPASRAPRTSHITKRVVGLPDGQDGLQRGFLKMMRSPVAE